MAGEESWSEWGHYVLEELKRLNICLAEVSRELTALRKEKEDLRREQNSAVEKLEDDLDTRLREAEKEIERLKERLKVSAILQVALTSVASVVAGWFGAKS